MHTKASRNTSTNTEGEEAGKELLCTFFTKVLPLEPNLGIYNVKGHILYLKALPYKNAPSKMYGIKAINVQIILVFRLIFIHGCFKKQVPNIQYGSQLQNLFLQVNILHQFIPRQRRVGFWVVPSFLEDNSTCKLLHLHNNTEKSNTNKKSHFRNSMLKSNLSWAAMIFIYQSL